MSMVPQDLRVQTTLGTGKERGEGRGEDIARAEKVGRLRREVGALKGLVDRWKADILRLKQIEELFGARRARTAELSGA